MRANRRRSRRQDPLASASAVESVLERLRAALPEVIPSGRKQLASLLNAVRGLYLRPEGAAGRGRPARFAREQLTLVDSKLRDILARETSISVRSFVGSKEVTDENVLEIMPTVGHITLTLQEVARFNERKQSY
jgi:hypothetical protein